jgi:hypothetical protein
MGNYYLRFIKSPEIKKDINFYFKKVYDGLILNYFSNYIINIRKKSAEREFIIHNYLSSFSETKLKFYKDVITICFSVDESKTNSLSDKSNTSFSKFNFKNDTICDLHILIDIRISKDEFKQKMIYKENKALIQLRKELNNVNTYSTIRIRKAMESKFPKLNKEFQEIEHGRYREWNRLLRLLKDCTDTSFQDNLSKLQMVANGVDLSNRYMILKKTDFFKRYSFINQIKPLKFIQNMKNYCLDDNALICLSNTIAKPLGTKLKTIEETEEFLINVINHFNAICYSKNSQIAVTLAQLPSRVERPYSCHTVDSLSFPVKHYY